MTSGASELTELLSASAWFRRVLDVVAEVDPPEWWVGAGVVGDIVWDTRFWERLRPSCGEGRGRRVL